MSKRLQQFLALGASSSLLIFFILWGMDCGHLTGTFLVLAFVGFALVFQSTKLFKNFSYTLWIFAAVVVAMYYPHYFQEIRGISLKILIVPLLQIIMFGMGATMSLKDFAGVIKMPYGVVVGVICQLTIMPFIGFGLAYTFGFPAEVAAGIVLVGASPSGLASNVMSYIAKANLALSVTLTAVATILAPIMTPFLMEFLAGEFIEINFLGMMWSITKIVIIPIIAGLVFNSVANHQAPRFVYASLSVVILIGLIILSNYLHRFFIHDLPLGSTSKAFLSQILVTIEFAVLWATLLGLFFYIIKKPTWINQILPIISMTAIALIITIITAAGRDSLLQIGALLILACLMHNITGYFLGYWACKVVGLDEKSCKTIALEVGMQNSGLASGIALEMGKVATVGLAPAVFGPLMNITGSSLATWWRGKQI